MRAFKPTLLSWPRRLWPNACLRQNFTTIAPKVFSSEAILLPGDVADAAYDDDDNDGHVHCSPTRPGSDS